jgi:hypothetical protein
LTAVSKTSQAGFPDLSRKETRWVLGQVFAFPKPTQSLALQKIKKYYGESVAQHCPAFDKKR